MRLLRELLHDVMSDRPSGHAIDEFITFCRATAAVLIRKRVATGRLSLQRVALSAEDLALDAVADLFSRNDEDRFPQLDAYFRGIDLCAMDDAELTSHVRRLVFAKVNQGIFRMYHEIDPSLSRIIRNIKMSINSLRNFDVVERFGEPYIRPSGCDSLEHLPPAELTVITRDLAMDGGPWTVPARLATLARVLRSQDQCSRLLPLVQVALAFRSSFGTPDSPQSTASEAETAAMEADVAEVIAGSCRWVKQQAYRKYVGAGKVSSAMFDRYFEVLEVALLSAILGKDGEDIHYYDELARRVDGLTREAYRVEHKSRLEYLGRIAHRRALGELKRSL